MPTGLVTKYLIELLAKQVADHSLVVWYDPANVYSSVAATLDLPGTTIARYDGSFFKLRHEIDPLMNGDTPPRLVVYVPLAQGETNNALIELEAAGVIVGPGVQPPNRNTRLAVVARNALKSLRGDENAAEIEKQVEAGKLTLADLNKLDDDGRGANAVVKLLFGTSNPQEVALAFVADSHFDADIEAKSAQQELVGLFHAAFEATLPDGASLVALRERLGRHVLTTDLVVALGDCVPAALAAIQVAETPAGIDHCTRLAKAWRNDREARESYVAAARQTSSRPMGNTTASTNWSSKRHKITPQPARSLPDSS